MNVVTPYFVGRLNWAPQCSQEPDIWRPEEPFGLVYKHWFVIIPPYCKTDGASIPMLLQPFLGKPFENDNKFWALPHDGGYRGYAQVVDMRRTIIPCTQLLAMCDPSPKELHMVAGDAIIPCRRLGRKWWDKMARDGAMVAAGTHWLKRHIIYRGLRIGGWWAWRKDRRR